jgi:spoIIIJ-associated protein
MSEPTRQALPDDAVGRVQAILEAVAASLGLDQGVTVTETDDEIRGVIGGEDVGLLIGKHGQTIDAVQMLCHQAAQRVMDPDSRKRVVIDAADYRERRSESLRRQGDVAAEESIAAGRPVEMESMSSAERRVVHEHLRERTEIETYSEGDEPNRYIVVAPLVSD